MTELFRMIEPPRACGYLPEETASLEIRAIKTMTPAEYSELLSRGYRRFGWQVFRPACRSCVACRSVRVLAQEFSPTARDRRILRKNAGIRAELHPLFVTREHLELYNRYHAFMHDHRGWPRQRHIAASYADSFLSGSSDLGRQWMYFDGERLVGVAFMDEAPGAISLVYCFYDPDWRHASPGAFSILTQLDYAKRQGFDYAYLGYWIARCQSMSYKGRFGPQEELVKYPADGEETVWRKTVTLYDDGIACRDRQASHQWH
jgi:arginine-tRNA-protein transferase